MKITTDKGRNSQQRLKLLQDSLKNLNNFCKYKNVENQQLKMIDYSCTIIQNGKDMYTGEINLSQIYRSHYSAVIHSDNRADYSSKSDDVPSIEVVHEMKSFWSFSVKLDYTTQI